jgi:Flp pilus assembly pilin Flp
MPTFPLITLVTAARHGLRNRLAAVRRTDDRGSHAVEYAIGIGLGAAAILAVFTAYKSGLDTVINGWLFK